MQIVDCGCLLALACKSLKNHWLAEQWEANMADREHYIFLQRGAPIFEKKNRYKTSMSKIIFSKPHLSNPVIRALHAQKTRDRRASFMQVGRSSMGLGSFNSFAEAGGAVVLGPKMNFSFWQFFRSWEATRIEKGARFHELQEKSTGWLHADLCYIMSGWRLAKTMLKHKRGAGEPKCNKHDSEIRKLGRFSWWHHISRLLSCCLHWGSATPLGSGDLFACHWSTALLKRLDRFKHIHPGRLQYLLICAACVLHQRPTSTSSYRRGRGFLQVGRRW